MENPSEARERRSQRDHSLLFKLAVVGEVGRGELSYKQAKRRYGIQGRSTVLTWCRRYASQFVTFQAAGPELIAAHDAAGGGGGPRHPVAKKVFPAAVRRLGTEKK